MNTHPRWRSPLHTIKDAISFSTDAARLRQPSYVILDVMQRYPPETQMDALFVLAVAMAESIGLNPHEMVARAKRILPEAEGPFTEQLQAARDYAKGELRR